MAKSVLQSIGLYDQQIFTGVTRDFLFYVVDQTTQRIGGQKALFPDHNDLDRRHYIVGTSAQQLRRHLEVSRLPG